MLNDIYSNILINIFTSQYYKILLTFIFGSAAEYVSVLSLKYEMNFIKNGLIAQWFGDFLHTNNKAISEFLKLLDVLTFLEFIRSSKFTMMMQEIGMKKVFRQQMLEKMEMETGVQFSTHLAQKMVWWEARNAVKNWVIQRRN